jgi:hypothetical protein
MTRREVSIYLLILTAAEEVAEGSRFARYAERQVEQPSAEFLGVGDVRCSSLTLNREIPGFDPRMGNLKSDNRLGDCLTCATRFATGRQEAGKKPSHAVATLPYMIRNPQAPR